MKAIILLIGYIYGGFINCPPLFYVLYVYLVFFSQIPFKVNNITALNRWKKLRHTDIKLFARFTQLIRSDGILLSWVILGFGRFFCVVKIVTFVGHTQSPSHPMCICVYNPQKCNTTLAHGLYKSRPGVKSGD